MVVEAPRIAAPADEGWAECRAPDHRIGTLRSEPIRFITSVDVRRCTPGSAPSPLS